MKHIGLICSPVPGHINPICTLGRALIKRGHRVTLFGIKDVEEKVLKQGVEFASYGEEEFPVGAWEKKWHPLAKEFGFKVIIKTIILHRILSRVMCRDITSKAKKIGIELFIVDQIQFQGKSIADALGIPFVTASCAIPVNRDPAEVSPPPFADWGQESSFLRILNKIGWKVFDLLSFPVLYEGTKWAKKNKTEGYWLTESSYSKDLQLLTFPPSFNFTSQFQGKNYYFVGPFMDNKRPQIDFPWEKLDPDKKKIYCSFGTLQNQIDDFFIKVAEACQDLDVQLIISFGQWLDSNEHPQLPGNPLVVNFAPQLELLEKVDLCITHAGYNTVIECLGKGVPMVAIPVTNDQPALGKRIEVSKTGKTVKIKNLSVENLKSAIQEVLDNPIYKERTLAIQSEIKSIGGVEKAAQLICEKYSL